MDCYASLRQYDESRVAVYGRFIQDAYYLYVALSAARIPVNTIQTAFVEKAFHRFCLSLAEVLPREGMPGGVRLPEVNSVDEGAARGGADE